MEVQSPPVPPHLIDNPYAAGRPAQFFPDASGFRVDGSHFTNVQGGMHIHPAQPVAEGPSRISPVIEAALANGSLEPFCSENEIYCKNLLRWKRGYPLLNSTPQANLPAEYRRRGISIGDVGRVTPEGGFDFFFNIYLPENHPINDNYIPDGFCPLNRFDARDVSTDAIRRGSVVSESVQPHCPDLDADHIELQFSCEGPSGALLALPYGSQLEKLQNIEAMRRYAAQNAESWYRYVNERRGRRLVNGGLYLITGCEKSYCGGMATFQNVAPGRDFDISLAPLANSDGSIKYRFLRGDPARTRAFSTPRPAGNHTDPANHTVFLHGFTISLGEGILGRLRGSVGFSQIGDHDNMDQKSPDGYIPFGSQGSFLSFSFASGLFTGGGPSDGMQASALGARDVHVSDLSPTSKILHPSQIINDKLIRMASKASVVITHDDDWADAMHENKGVFTESTLLDKVLDNFEIETEAGTAFLMSNTSRSRKLWNSKNS
ncbi:hypothetical protein C8F01DRAFT_663039 [Mycena amicta]|nr:hypothetical protein C8F01DRAFT_663039 [Mycena amicta]